MKNVIKYGALIVVILCLIWISQIESIETREGLLLSIILAISTSLVSWIVTSHYAKVSLAKENMRLIDRIGAQSSEKILNQSKQLYSIEQYLDEKQLSLFGKDTSNEAVIYLESTRNMIRLIRTSNNTYLNDWAGVVSDDVKQEMLKQRNVQSQLFEDINLINYTSFEKRTELEEKIEKYSKELPSYLVPSSNPKANHATIFDHIISENGDNKKKGILKVLISEECYKGHVVGKFEDEFDKPPQKSNSSVIKSPNGRQNIAVFAKTGTVYDFHVGLKSMDFNVPLAPGVYEIEYSFET